MAERTEHFNKEGAPEFADEAIRRFLLGHLVEAERRSFEERLFADESLDRQVRLAEYELADDYAFERLPAVDRALFEQKFLVSTDRKQKLSVSRALRDHLASPALAATRTNATATIREGLF